MGTCAGHAVSSRLYKLLPRNNDLVKTVRYIDKNRQCLLGQLVAEADAVSHAEMSER